MELNFVVVIIKSDHVRCYLQFRNWVFLAFRNLPFSISFCLRSHFECNIILFSFVRFYFVSLSLFWSFCANVSAARLRMARFHSHFRSHFVLQLVLVRRFRFEFTLSLSVSFPFHLSLSRSVHQLGGRFIFSQIKCTNVVVEKLNWIRRSVFGYYHIQRLLGLQFCAQKPYEIAKRLQSKYAKQTDSDAGDCTHSLPFMRTICYFFCCTLSVGFCPKSAFPGALRKKLNAPPTIIVRIKFCHQRIMI